jgi:DNA-binding response OmpR family regulator
MKILVIDDDVMMRRVVAKILLADGYDVVTAADGISGMTLFAREKPEIVITDIVMPQQEGFETILTLRRDAVSVKIIAISGGDSELLETARLIGADDVLEKPIRAHELLNCVRALGAVPAAR